MAASTLWPLWRLIGVWRGSPAARGGPRAPKLESGARGSREGRSPLLTGSHESAQTAAAAIWAEKPCLAFGRSCNFAATAIPRPTCPQRSNLVLWISINERKESTCSMWCCRRCAATCPAEGRRACPCAVAMSAFTRVQVASQVHSRGNGSHGQEGRSRSGSVSVALGQRGDGWAAERCGSEGARAQCALIVAAAAAGG